MPITFVHVSYAGPIHTVTVNGKPMRFEFHRFCGPVVLNKDDSPRKNQPGERHPFWKEFDKWFQANKRR